MTQERVGARFITSKIPPPSKRQRESIEEMELYNEKYQIAEHDERYKLALSIRTTAWNTKSAKEPRWSSVIKEEVFGNLIRLARRAEGITVFDPKQVVER